MDKILAHFILAALALLGYILLTALGLDGNALLGFLGGQVAGLGIDRLSTTPAAQG